MILLSSTVNGSNATCSQVLNDDAIQINEYMDNVQSMPNIQALSCGRVVVAWHDMTREKLFYRIYDNDMVPITGDLESPMSLNWGASMIVEPTIEALKNSCGFIMAITSGRDHGTGVDSRAIDFNIYDENGVPQHDVNLNFGATTQMANGVWSEMGSPSFNVFDDDSFILAADRRGSDLCQGTVGWCQWIQFFDANGSPVGESKRIDTAGTVDVHHPSLNGQRLLFGRAVVLENQNFVWTSYATTGDATHYYKVFNHDGTALHGNEDFKTYVEGNGNLISTYEMKAFKDGFLAVWVQDPNFGDSFNFRRVMGQQLDAEGNKIGNNFLISDNVAANTYHSAELEILPTGGFLAFWESMTGTIYSRSFDHNCLPTSGVIDETQLYSTGEVSGLSYQHTTMLTNGKHLIVVKSLVVRGSLSWSSLYEPAEIKGQGGGIFVLQPTCDSEPTDTTIEPTLPETSSAPSIAPTTSQPTFGPSAALTTSQPTFSPSSAPTVADSTNMCDDEQVKQGCCNKSIFSDEPEWEFQQVGGSWSSTADYIRYDILDDTRCGGTANMVQTGTATLDFDSNRDMNVVLEMEGVAESSYEKFDLYVDGEHVVTVQATDNDFCQVGTCRMCDVAMPATTFALAQGAHTMTVEITTKDALFHQGAYFMIYFSTEPEDHCGDCECLAPTATPTFAPSNTPTVQCQTIDIGVDGSFESLTEVATHSTISDNRNGNVVGAGWHNGLNTADSWMTPMPIESTGYFGGMANGVPSSPDGGVFAAAAANPNNGYTESFYVDVQDLIVGSEYTIRFFQVFAGQDGYSQIAEEEAKWKVQFGDDIMYSDPISYEGAGAQTWHLVQLVTIPTETSQRLEFTSQSASGDHTVYIGVDGIHVVQGHCIMSAMPTVAPTTSEPTFTPSFAPSTSEPTFTPSFMPTSMPIVSILECDANQVDEGCCSSTIFAEEPDWTFTQVGGQWSSTEDYVRYDIANSAECGGVATGVQTGTAVLDFDANQQTVVVLEMTGMAESSYEKFQLYVDDALITTVQATDSDLCSVSTCDMCSVEMAPELFELTPGAHTMRVEITTVDGRYHEDAYFQITFSSESAAECNGCTCEKPVTTEGCKGYKDIAQGTCTGSDFDSIRGTTEYNWESNVWGTFTRNAGTIDLCHEACQSVDGCVAFAQMPDLGSACYIYNDAECEQVVKDPDNIYYRFYVLETCEAECFTTYAIVNADEIDGAWAAILELEFYDNESCDGEKIAFDNGALIEVGYEHASGALDGGLAMSRTWLTDAHADANGAYLGWTWDESKVVKCFKMQMFNNDYPEGLRYKLVASNDAGSTWTDIEVFEKTSEGDINYNDPVSPTALVNLNQVDYTFPTACAVDSDSNETGSSGCGEGGCTDWGIVKYVATYVNVEDCETFMQDLKKTTAAECGAPIEKVTIMSESCGTFRRQMVAIDGDEETQFEISIATTSQDQTDALNEFVSTDYFQSQITKTLHEHGFDVELTNVSYETSNAMNNQEDHYTKYAISAVFAIAFGLIILGLGVYYYVYKKTANKDVDDIESNLPHFTGETSLQEVLQVKVNVGTPMINADSSFTQYGDIFNKASTKIDLIDDGSDIVV